MSLVNPSPSQMIPSSADWSRLEPKITDLYTVQQCSMEQIRQRLEDEDGFRVTKKMVRKRISDWHLHRNQQTRDMAAAIRLLDPDPNLWPSHNPHFLIRRRSYTLHEILCIIWQKKGQNPFQWAHSIDAGRRTPHVTLEDDPGETASEGSSSPYETFLFSHSQLVITKRASHSMQILTSDEKAVSNFHAYCSYYKGLVALGHVDPSKPPVHSFTIHGQFSEWIRDGLAHMMRNGSDAFPSFHSGFKLVKDLLTDCHPMALGQYLAVVCALSEHRANDILRRLLEYFTRMAVILHAPESVIEFLSAIQSSQDVLASAIMSLRAAVEAFSGQSSVPWQRFYMESRLCDCLYIGKAHYEGSEHLARLLCDQEALDGPLCRNVLWNLIKAAEGQLYLGNVNKAEEQYTIVRERSNLLTGLGRAKMRFAALEGLADIKRRRFEEMRHGPVALSQDASALQELQEAYCYLEEAISEAKKWFQPSSRRRIVRASEHQSQIAELLASFQEV